MVQMKISKFIQIHDIIRSQIQLSSLNKEMGVKTPTYGSDENGSSYHVNVFIDDFDNIANKCVFIELRINTKSAQFYKGGDDLIK